MTDPAVEVHEATLSYGGVPAVQCASFQVERGAFAGIVGPSGAGKTTLLRALLGGVPSVRGRVRVLGNDVRWGRPPAGIGYVPQLQTVDWNFPITVTEAVLLGRAMRTGPWPWSRRTDQMEVARLLDRLGIGGLGNRHIRELSGGQQQRVFLARALIAHPDVLLLDEPTSGIDIKTRDEVLHLLAEINGGGVTVILTTHELNAVAAHLPDVICVNRGVIAQGDPDTVFTPAVLSRTYGADLQVVRQDGLLLVADAAPHALRDALHHHHHGHDDGSVHAHDHEHDAPHIHHHTGAAIGNGQPATGKEPQP
jgi:zinc/manganese transport system ATP-binding protein/zinc transport system ATP-binding protein